MRSRLIKGQKGQTSVEYIFMLVVVVTVSVSVFNKIEKELISDPDSWMNSYLKSFKTTFRGKNGSFSGSYKYFTIVK